MTDSPPHTSRPSSGILFLIAAALLAAFSPGCSGTTEVAAEEGQQQGPAAVEVRYTEAQQHSVRRSLSLPGTVEALTSSIVASTISGQVIEFTAKEGMRVESGQVLARLRTATIEIELAARQASLREAEARLKLAEANQKRAENLFEEGIISRQQYDDATSEYTAWLGRVDTLRAEIARVEDAIERCTIRAPFGGVVVAERTEVGQWVVEGGAVVELVAMGQVDIRVEVPERYFAAMRLGSAAQVTFEALPGVELPGRVIAVVPSADPQARNFPAKVRVPNPDGRIGAGMLAQVTFPAGEVYAATVVPKDAVVRQGDRSVLYRVNGGHVEMVPVETGEGVGVWVEVRGALRAGDRVVTRGNERLAPGQAVRATVLEYERP
jgi:RND family efflux transporter MFP subunit